MRLAPTAEQQQLKDAVRRFCAEQVTAERLCAWDKTDTGVDADCWSKIADLGWFGLGLPVAAGGSGAGLIEVACVLEECARGLVPRRISNAIRGGLALARLDPANRHLAAASRGECVIALALDEQRARAPGRYATQISNECVSGEKWCVAEGTTAGLHLVAARDGDTPALVLVAAQHATASPLRTFDGERQAVVRYDRAPLLQRLAAGATEVLAIIRQQTALALAEMIGGMDAALDMTVAYVKEREQFGQKLAVFQAVQHQVADMAISVTASRHLAWQAITRLAAGTQEGGELATAAAFVAQACKRITLAAHHLHGGAGYVVEHPLHYHAERAQSLCIRYAPEAPALAEVAARLLD